MIVSEIAGTTRDCVDVRFEMDGHAFVAIDTAGVRKRKSWSDDIETHSHHRAQAAIERADVCVLLLDAREKVSQIEKRLALELVTQHKPTAIVVNKWDLVENELSPEDYTEYLTQATAKQLADSTRRSRAFLRRGVQALVSDLARRSSMCRSLQFDRQPFTWL